MKDSNIEFLLKATAFASSIDGEENLIALFVSSLGLNDQNRNCTAEEHLKAMITIAEKHNMLKK